MCDLSSCQAPGLVQVGTLIMFLLTYTGHAADVVDEELCEEGWVFDNNYCYFFSQINFTLSMKDAAHDCFHRDAEFAWPKTKDELAFLQAQVRKSGAYGFVLNLEWFSIMKKHAFFDVLTGYFKYFDADNGSVPDIQSPFDKSQKCVGFHVPLLGKSAKKDDVWFETSPCSVSLHVACQGNLVDFPNQVIDGNKWFSYKSYIFWLAVDMVDHKLAAGVCQTKGMSLVKNAKEFSIALGATEVVADAIPWWWSDPAPDGGEKEHDDLNWEAPHGKYGTYILLSTGKAYVLENLAYSGTLRNAMPYICKRRATKTGRFGCPQLWIRGGDSCYVFVKHKKLTWEKARDSCKLHDGHLLKIDSTTEKLWFEMFKFDEIRTSYRLWTSGNDRNEEGHFVWHDDSDVNSQLFPWKRGFSGEDLSLKRCAVFYIPSKSITFYYKECSENAAPACQYTLEDDEASCVKGWKLFEKTCYMLDDTTSVPYDMNVIKCLSKTEGVKIHRVKNIQVQGQGVVDFLKQAFAIALRSRLFWLGLEAKEVVGEYHWDDGTLDDGSRFRGYKEPDNGASSGTTPQNCISTDHDGFAYDDSCERKLRYICEKKVEPKHAALSSIRGNTAKDLKGSLLFVWSVVIITVWRTRVL